MSRQTSIRRGSLGALIAVGVLLLVAASASAAIGPKWKIRSLSNTTAQPGGELVYEVQAENVGDQAMNGSQIQFNAELAPGMSVKSVLGNDLGDFEAISCSNEAATVSCANSFALRPHRVQVFTIVVALEAGLAAGQTLKSDFTVSGGGAPAVSTVDPTLVSGSPPPFGVDAFDLLVGDAAGTVDTGAGAHPDSITTWIDFNSADSPTQPKAQGPLAPIEPVRDAFVDLPPGLLGNLSSLPRCTLADVANSTGGASSLPLCDPASQLGVASTSFYTPPSFRPLISVPLFNLDPPPGAPARFGFAVAGSLVVFDAQLRSDSDYGLTVVTHNIPEGLAAVGSEVVFWGVPADEGHTKDRGCPGEVTALTGVGKTCPANVEPTPILRNPTSCQGPLTTSAHIDSWTDPGAFTASGAPDLSDPAWETAASVSHKAPGYPYPPDEWGEAVGTRACGGVPFTPSISAQPSTNQADSPSGLKVDLSIPQECWEAEEASSTCQSDLKDAEVTLPAGMSVNPSSATGLGACTPDQVGLTTPTGSAPIHFDVQPANCPDNAKIGDVSIDTPLLGKNQSPDEQDLKGAVYLAKQTENPFNSLLAMYLVAEGSGVVVKQAGEIRVEPNGQLTTVFKDAPQTPFSNLHLELYGGPRAALKTPPTCGPYTTEAKLTPWARPQEDVLKTSTFEITNCPNSGFDPKLHAGTANPLAGAYSPFALRLTREDGTQELGAIRLGVPPGLLANLKGIPYCPDAALAAVSGALGTGAAQIANPSCPAASQVGTVTAGAGAGPTPFYSQTGKAYWAGPYKGAPVSLAAVVPAVAGPFDLGSVVVRNRFEVDPETAKITAVSDPLPSALHGIPLDLRDVRVNLDRPNYTLNPTSCDPMAFSSDITSTAGAHASPTERFQAGGCDRLAFKPKLSLALKGGTKRRGHPALRATLTMPEGGANIAKASVALPHAEFLDQSHIGTVCTRVQYAANQCPAKSVYGYARAYSPILDYYLQGPVYLRSSSHQLPDLVASLGGQIQIDVAGRIDTFKGGVRASFESVPDAPVSKFVLTMAGGKKGLIENSEDLCASPQRATALFDGQNGKSADFKPLLKVKCGGKAKKAGKKHGHGY